MLAREIASLLASEGVGIFGTSDPTARTIFVGELPTTPTEGLYVIPIASPQGQLYIDTEYPVIDFWYVSAHTDRAYAKLELVFELLHRRTHYSTPNFYISLSYALGTIIDVDRTGERSKLFRLSVQFISRNLNHVS